MTFRIEADTVAVVYIELKKLSINRKTLDCIKALAGCPRCGTFKESRLNFIPYELLHAIDNIQENGL